MKLTWINTKWVKIMLHIAAWIIIFSLPFLLSPAYSNRRPEPDREQFIYLMFLTGLFWVIVFYVNAYLLTPKFIYTRKYLLYTLLLIAIYCVVMLMHGFLFTSLITTRPFNFLRSASFNLTTYLLTVAASIIYKMMWDKTKEEKLVQQKHEENLKTELSFLRSQISPHFVFNVLNNMVALVRLKSDQLEPTIMKLSSLMQYMLYETDEEKVMLTSEIEYLQSYIDLQQQRFGTKVKVNFAYDVDDSTYSVEPMMMIPFVENAFKHGVGMIEKPEINIKLVTTNNVLNFTVNNKFNEESLEIKDKTSGIGLANVMRRLNLLYGSQHSLLISRKDGWFSVSLQLNLH